MRAFLSALAVFAALGMRARSADACIPLGQEVLALDPAYADDTVAPMPIRDVTYAVHRRLGGDCGNLAAFWIYFVTSDDRAPFARLGYEIRARSGVDDRIAISDRIRVPGSPGELFVYYQDEGQDLDVTLEIVVVDLNGNRSEPATVRVQDDTFGCSAAAGDAASSHALLLALAALVAIRCRGGRTGRRGARAHRA